MSTTVINVPVSQEVYERLEKIAARVEQPVETVLDETLRAVLPREDGIPTTVQHEVEALPRLTVEELREVAGSEMNLDDQAALEELLDIQNLRPLTQREIANLDQLRSEYGRILLRKARAFALLAERGQPMPF